MRKNIIANAAGQALMAQAKFFMGYSRWDELRGAYETWDEAVDRVMTMHRTKYADRMTETLEQLLTEGASAYKEQLILGAQRALQFGGEQLLKHEAKMYNCASSYLDRVTFFNEAMYLLLCGCGVGFSVQYRHIKKLGLIYTRTGDRVLHVVEDSIEGWADAFAALMSSFTHEGKFKQYANKVVVFDYSQVRPRGAKISGGFKAPGPDGLRTAIEKCEALLNDTIYSHTLVKTMNYMDMANDPAKVLSAEDKADFAYLARCLNHAQELMEVAEVPHGAGLMRPIVAYDFVMHMADAVLSGGVRRSATICLFDKRDFEMMRAKTGDWFKTNPQRGRSNNSVVLKRDELERGEWAEIMHSVRDYGEPGFLFVDDLDITVNPCVEIGMFPQTEDGESGWQFCNLVETNGGKCTSPEMLYRAVRSAAILATFQAGYTNFKYLSDASRKITEREALIGVSITGWMDNPKVLFDEEVLRKAAQIVKEVNEYVAKLLGINPAARTTCAKPSGNASVLLQTSSGIHGAHSALYIRHVQMHVDDDVAQLIMRVNPKMVEKSVSSPTDVIVAFPVVSKPNSIFKSELMGVKQLEYVKKAQNVWVEEGTNLKHCVRPFLRHNISNTISVDNWDEVEDYLYDNRDSFAGVSLLAAVGDKAYAQAPFTEVFTPEQIVEKYGVASMFASGLIVDGLAAFNGDLWRACSLAMYEPSPEPSNMPETPLTVLQEDWLRRFVKFANNYFDEDLLRTSLCLKDCYNIHKWEGIMRDMVDINFSEALTKEKLIDVDTMGSQACAGNACEIKF